MNLTHERIATYANRLNLTQIEAILPRLAEEATAKELSYSDFLESVLAEEACAADERMRRTLLRFARFPYLKTLEDFDFAAQPSVDKKQTQELSNLTFVTEKSNIILLGPPGVGKTHLAIALGLKAAESGYRVYFTTATDMLSRLKKGFSTGRFDEYLRTYLRCSVLIIDEMGYLPLDRDEANLLFQVIAKRYEKGSIILTSNKSYGAWGEVVAQDNVLAAAILDRLLHHSTTINIKGESYRLKDKRRAGILSQQEVMS